MAESREKKPADSMGGRGKAPKARRRAEAPSRPVGEAPLRYDAAGVAAMLAIAAFVVATRFWALGEKPFHHDESMFAHRAYFLATRGDYNFEPILHGPFLEDVTAAIFRVVGDSDATARLWSAIAGTLLLVLVWRLRDVLGIAAAWSAVVLLAVSPTLLFYSRFNRNDVSFALAATATLFCAVRFLRSGRLRWWFLGLLSAAWMVCIKENYVIFFFTAASYFVALAAVEQASGHGAEIRAAVRRLVFDGERRRAAAFSAATILGLATGAFLIVLLFTTFFNHPEHWDGPIEAIRYWAGQNREQRIYGDFHYYIPLALIYEFVPLALLVWGVGRALRRARWFRGWVAWGWAAWSALLLAALWGYRFPREFEQLTHMSRGWHLWLAVEVFALGGAAFAVLVGEGRRLDAFFLWWTLTAFLAYSYAGEKVPWISVHIFFPMAVTAGIFAREIARDALGGNRAAATEPSRPTLGEALRPFALWGRSGFGRLLISAAIVAGVAFTAFSAVRLSFENEADPAERHVYTHTTPDYKAMVEDIRDMAARLYKGPTRRFPVFVEGASQWPAEWYFRRFLLIRPQKTLPPPATLRRLPILVFDEYLDREHRKEPALARWPWLLETHVVRRVPFREWWHQRPLQVTVRRLPYIWMALVPKQYRRARITDALGRPTGPVGDPGGLSDMTVADEIGASRRAWRCLLDYWIFRWDFDPYRSPYRTRDYMAVLFCVRKDFCRKWLRAGGRFHPSRARRVRRLP